MSKFANAASARVCHAEQKRAEKSVYLQSGSDELLIYSAPVKSDAYRTTYFTNSVHPFADVDFAIRVSSRETPFDPGILCVRLVDDASGEGRAVLLEAIDGRSECRTKRVGRTSRETSGRAPSGPPAFATSQPDAAIRRNRDKETFACSRAN